MVSSLCNTSVYLFILFLGERQGKMEGSPPPAPLPPFRQLISVWSLSCSRSHLGFWRQGPTQQSEPDLKEAKLATARDKANITK